MGKNEETLKEVEYTLRNSIDSLNEVKDKLVRACDLLELEIEEVIQLTRDISCK